jgi:hypothetical protein
MTIKLLIRDTELPTIKFTPTDYMHEIWETGDGINTFGAGVRRKGWLLEIDGEAEVISPPATQAA